jgi:hypothetical protein
MASAVTPSMATSAGYAMPAPHHGEHRIVARGDNRAPSVAIVERREVALLQQRHARYRLC